MPSKICDEFSELATKSGRPMSKQQRYQMRMRRAGKCRVCGESARGTRCDRHLAMHMAAKARKRKVVSRQRQYRKQRNQKREAVRDIRDWVRFNRRLDADPTLRLMCLAVLCRLRSKRRYPKKTPRTHFSDVELPQQSNAFWRQ
jgi:hypothetical protein